MNTDSIKEILRYLFFIVFVAALGALVFLARHFQGHTWKLYPQAGETKPVQGENFLREPYTEITEEEAGSAHGE